MFDCCLVESYGQKKRQKKRVQVWCTDYSYLWNLGTPPMRRHPNSNNLTKEEWLKVISMVVDMETKDSLKRCAIMVIAKNIQLARADLLYYKHKNILLLLCTPVVLIYNSELGLIISSEFFCAKKLRKKLFTP